MDLEVGSTASASRTVEAFASVTPTECTGNDFADVVRRYAKVGSCISLGFVGGGQNCSALQ